MSLPNPSKFYYEHHNDAPEDMLKSYAEEAIRAYAKWYEKNSLPEDQQNEDWMIEQNVKSFLEQ